MEYIFFYRNRRYVSKTLKKKISKIVEEFNKLSGGIFMEQRRSKFEERVFQNKIFNIPSSCVFEYNPEIYFFAKKDLSSGTEY